MKTDQLNQNSIISKRLSLVLDQLESLTIFDKKSAENILTNEKQGSEEDKIKT